MRTAISSKEDDDSQIEDEEEVQAAPAEDPYLAHDAAGRRAKRIRTSQIPDLRLSSLRDACPTELERQLSNR